MLFQSQIPGIFQNMQMALDDAANRARKAEAAKRLDYYHDIQADYLLEQLAAVFAEPEALTPVFVNVVKKVVNNLAAVYMRDAVREVEGIDQDQELFRLIADSCSLPIKLKTASRYTKLLKTILLRPVWRQGRMDLDILTGEVLDVTTGDTPEDLQSVLITHFPESGRQDDVEFTHWTAEAIKRLDYRGNVISEEANPYKLLPFIPCWDRSPTNMFWLSGGDDLINIQDAINERLTDLAFLCRQQSYGVGWIKGGGKTGGSTLKAGPGSLVELQENGELGFESQKAQITALIGAIDFLITQAALCNGLSASTLSTKVVRESGVAKTAGNRELEELRRDDIALFRRVEQQLFNMFRVVWNHHNRGRKISDKANLRVDFYDPKPQTTPKEQAEMWQMLVDLGVVSPVDIILERNPDLKDREQARQYLERIKEENQNFGGATNANLSQ